MKRLETIQIEDTKEYADAYTQHEPAEFTTSHSSQTDPELKRTMASFSIQIALMNKRLSFVDVV